MSNSYVTGIPCTSKRWFGVWRPRDTPALTASWQSFTECHPLHSGIAPPCFFPEVWLARFCQAFPPWSPFCGCMRQFLCLQQVRKDSNMTWTVLATVRGIIQFDHSVCDLACFMFRHSTCLGTVNVFSNLQVTHGSRAAANSPAPL